MTSWLNGATFGGIVDRGWPAVTSAAVVTVLATSRVDLNLLLVAGLPATVLAVGYAVAMASLVGAPNNLTLHRVTFALSVLFWGGRAGGFLDLVVTHGRGDLWGAVAERASMFVAVATLHLIAARRIGYLEALRARGITV